MLKKLFLAVLVISLILGLSGSAIGSGTRPAPPKINFEPEAAQPDGEKAFSHNPYGEAPPTLRAPELTAGKMVTPYPSPMDPSHECEILDYLDFDGTFFVTGGFDGTAPWVFASRFNTQALHSKSIVRGAALLVWDYDATNDDIGLEFYVYEDDGGLPGTILHTETFDAAWLQANVPNPFDDFMYFPFSTDVEVAAESYFIGVTTIGTGTPDDYIDFGFNNNADGSDNGRSLVQVDPTTWIPNGGTGGFFSIPVHLAIMADVCYQEYSDCYTWSSMAGGTGWTSNWLLPDDDWTNPGTLAGMGQQMVSLGEDTLKTIYFQHLVDAAFASDFAYYPADGTNGIEVSIWPDDGSGNVDMSGGPLATETVSGLADLFPYTGNVYDPSTGWWDEVAIDFSSYNLVFRGPWHVTVKMTSDNAADGMLIFPTSHPVNNPGFTGLSTDFHDVGDPTVWERATEPGGFWEIEGYADRAFYILAEVCPSEYTMCDYKALYDSYPANWHWFALSDPTGTEWADKVAQKVDAKGGQAKPEMVRFQITEGSGTPGVRLLIWEASGNYPGDLIYSYDILDPVYEPGWNQVVIPWGQNEYIEGDFFVGFEIIPNDPLNDYFWVPTEDATFNPINGGCLIWDFYDEVWYDLDADFGYTDNLMMEVQYCYNPASDRPCDGGDWSTLQSDFARTGASGISIGDAACDLTYNWEYEHPTLFGQYVGPVIFDGKLITTWRSTTSGSEYQVYDLYSKNLLYSIPVDGPVTGIPTAAHIAYNDKDMLFITGGDDLVAAGYDLDAGTVIWEIHAGDLPGMGTGETNAMGNFIIDGNGILYFTTNVGKVYCVWADDGLQWGGIWPIDYYQIGAPGPTTNRTGAFDGSDLYYGYSTILGGDIASVSTADGSENWTLTSADGLKAFETWGPGSTVEQFSGGVSVDVDEGYLYAVSTLASNVYPQTAVFYKINASNGTAEEYEQCNGYNWMCTPVIGLNHVFVQFSPPGGYWVQQVNEGNVQAFRKDNGDYDWGVLFGEFNNSDPVFAEMVLTCEPDGGHDLLFVFAGEGGLHCIDIDDGVEVFNRHIADTMFGGSAGAIGYDTSGEVHMVFETVLGRVIDLTAQEDRPRLELQTAQFRAPVPFGNDDPYVVTFEEVYANTGCTDLEVEITLSDVTNGAPGLPVSMIRPGLEADAASLADQLTPGKDLMRTADIPGEPLSKDQIERTLVNPASTALYSWIKNPVITHTVAPGEFQNIDVEVVQGDVGRGVFLVYAWFDTNDPDYWLDILAAPPLPECQLVFMGGCVTEQTYFEFGTGLVNKQEVYNSGRLADGGEEGPTFGGSNGVLFQGMYSMAISTHRLAFNVHSWITGSTDEWHAWLPDPYDGSCIPYLDADIQLGASTEDGLTYTPIMGNAVMYNSIDSVKNFDDGTGVYDWTNFDAPYDNDSTMGLYIVHRTLGAYEFGNSVDLIGNASVEIFNITERNGRALPGWKMGNYLDYDVGSVDTAWLDQSISAGMVFGESPGAAQDVHGMIKIPFGCGEDPMINAWSVDQDSGMFGDGEDGYFDVAYDMMSAPAGGEYNHGNFMSQVAEDQAASFTIAAHDFEPYETIEFAVANYWVYDTPNNHAELARLANQLNKWMGYGRGDVNNDDAIDLADIIWLANYVNYSGPGPIPFEHLGDVDADGDTDNADTQYLLAYYFDCGPCPLGEMLNK